MTLLLRGESYKKSEGYWQPLELRRPGKLLKEEQQALRTKLQRDINIDGAFVDRVILNLYTGAGATEVWVDDLEIGPVIESPAKGRTPGMTTSRTNIPPVPPTGVTPVPPPSAVQPPKGSRVAVEFNRENLYVGGRKFLMRGVRYTDTPLKTLRDAGLNTLFIGDKMETAVYEEAVREGFWLVPSLPPGTPDPEVVARDVGRFAADDAVLFWYLGADVGTGQVEAVTRTAQAVRTADPNRPLAIDAWDGLPMYSRQVDLLSAHRFPLMTSLELPQYRDWLNSRRQLDRFGTFQWTWVQTHLPDWYTALAYDREPEPARRTGPARRPIRRADRPAAGADSPAHLHRTWRAGAGHSASGPTDSWPTATKGATVCCTLALLNQELQMLEPLMLSAVEPRCGSTRRTPGQGGSTATDRGVLVLPMWMGRGSQFVPASLPSSRLNMIVPMVPTGTQAWVVSPWRSQGARPTETDCRRQRSVIARVRRDRGRGVHVR